MALDLEMLLNPDEDYSTPQTRQALADALRKKQRYGAIGQLMGVQPTAQVGAGLQDQAQGSLKSALAKQQAAKEAATAAAQRKTEGERFQMNYDQRERGIEATRTNQGIAQSNAAAGLDLRRQAAERAAAAAQAALEAKNIASGIKQRTEQDKYSSAVSSGNDVIAQLESIYNHPGRKGATGGSWAAGYIPATDARDYRIKIGQLQGAAFLAAFNSLKGGGQITEAEGAKATQAITTLGDLTASEQAHEQALKDFYELSTRLRDRARSRAKEVGTPQEIMDTTEVGTSTLGQASGTQSAQPNRKQGRDGKWYYEQNGEWFAE